MFKETKMWVADVLTPWTVFCQILAVAVCLFGDYMLSLSWIQEKPTYRAITDSTTHGLVGLVCWASVTGDSSTINTVIEVCVCGILAAIIDVDHFIAAKSLQLDDALSLSSRPFLHNSSVVLVTTLTLFLLRPLLYKVLPMQLVMHLPWLLFIAWGTHHIRDATRRGLWFAPFGSTAALPRSLYIGLILLLPLVIRTVFVLSAGSEEIVREKSPV